MMALKLDMWHWVLENCQDCSNSDLRLTLTCGKVKYGKMLEGKFRIFFQDSSNDPGLTLSFLWQGQICSLVQKCVQIVQVT